VFKGRLRVSTFEICRGNLHSKYNYYQSVYLPNSLMSFKNPA
jgi:hypothetical protein